MYLGQIGCEVVVWIHVASYRIRWWDYMNMTIFLLTTLGPRQPPIQWVPGALSLGVKRPGREVDNSFPSSAEVQRTHGIIPPLPNTP
jgi:hypothetical protein